MNEKKGKILTEEEIEKTLRNFLNNSYCPYSKFRVSALITMKDGNYFLGVNVENAGYGSTNCAERSAVYAAVTYGYSREDFDKLYCMTGATVEDVENVSASCGACLQVMSEFFNENAECTFYDFEGKKVTFTLLEMMPHAFTIRDLQLDEEETSDFKRVKEYKPVSKEEYNS